MHEHYEKDGYTVISKNPTRDINAKGHKGIDGVYYKKDGHPPFIIGEAKYGSGRSNWEKSSGQTSYG